MRIGKVPQARSPRSAARSRASASKLPRGKAAIIREQGLRPPILEGTVLESRTPVPPGGEGTVMQEAGDIALEVERTIERLDQVRREIGRVIFGQERVVDETLITILAGGHVLLVGVPGLAKTRLTETLGTVLGLVQKRVQFTPDLMPADILGSEVLEETAAGARSFRFIAGPVFAQLL